MKTLGPKSNFRVVVTPRGMGDFGSISVSHGLLYGSGKTERARAERDMQSRCDDIVSDIKRHVDNARHIEVEFDQDSVCEHCGAAWTETSNTYNGGCCSKDEESAPQGETA